MSEKICVVTGATSGIGKEIARALASAGARLAVICRDQTRGRSTAMELARSNPGVRLDLFQADISVLADVHRVAAELHQQYGHLNVLVNNAGIHDVFPAISPDGFDRMIATNHLGPFLLTHLLLDLLERGAPARIVMIASEAHRNASPIDPAHFAGPGTYGPLGSVRIYGQSKLLNILFAQEFALRHDASKIAANSMCPGLVATGLIRWLPLSTPLLSLAAHTPLLRTPAQGAVMAVRLAIDPVFEGRSGGFFTTTPGMDLLPPARARLDPRLQRVVWEHTQHLVGLS